MEITLSLDRYTIMEHVSAQASEFIPVSKMICQQITAIVKVEANHLANKYAREYRMADMYYLLKELEPEKWQAKDVKVTLEWLADMGLVKRKEIVKYKCYGFVEKIRYLHAQINEKISLRIY